MVEPVIGQDAPDLTADGGAKLRKQNEVRLVRQERKDNFRHPLGAAAVKDVPVENPDQGSLARVSHRLSHMTLPTPLKSALVVATREVPGVIKVDAPGVDVTLKNGPASRLDRPGLLKHVQGAHVVISMYSDKVDAEFLDAAGPQIRGVCNLAVGYENIDLAECTKRGIQACNTPDAVTEGTADMAWLLILATARRLIEADRFARGGEWARHGPLGMAEFLGQDLTGKTRSSLAPDASVMPPPCGPSGGVWRCCTSPEAGTSSLRWPRSQVHGFRWSKEWSVRMLSVFTRPSPQKRVI